MQKNSAFLWRPFVQRKTKETFVSLSFISHIITVISYCCFVSASDWGTEQGWCELVLLWHRFETRSADFFFLFFICFSSYFKNQNIYLRKHGVKAAKSNCLSSRRVEICLRKIRSLRCRFMQKWVFLRTLFLENEVQIDRNNYVTIFKKNLFIYLLNKNSIIYTTHITILNSQYIIKHYLQYIIKILETLTLFLFTYLFIYLFIYVFIYLLCFHAQQTNRQKTKQIPKLTCNINWGYNSYLHSYFTLLFTPLTSYTKLGREFTYIYDRL